MLHSTEFSSMNFSNLYSLPLSLKNAKNITFIHCMKRAVKMLYSIGQSGTNTTTYRSSGKLHLHEKMIKTSSFWIWWVRINSFQICRTCKDTQQCMDWCFIDSHASDEVQSHIKLYTTLNAWNSKLNEHAFCPFFMHATCLPVFLILAKRWPFK